eukprot:95818_1
MFQLPCKYPTLVTTLALTLMIVLAIGDKIRWIKSDILLPRGIAAMAVAHYNKSVYLLGGNNNKQQMIQYDIDGNEFIDHGTNILLFETHGYGQYYTQSGNVLYIISALQSFQDTLFYLSTFNLQTNVYELDWNDIQQFEIEYGACLTSTNNYIFMLGGQSNHDITYNNDILYTVQMLNLLTDAWISNVPSMKMRRAYHSCIVHPSTEMMYAIGGYDGSNAKSVIEKIDTVNIKNKDWEYIEDLTKGLTNTR